tara:strand:+ start:351 stop:1358 length:1008 start_codon:yes stop_codon:yes gene_type:complete
VKSFITPLLLFSSLALPELFSHYPENFERPLTKIALGSCNRQNLPQPIWPVIHKTQPDLWIWSGDCVYVDSPNETVISRKFDLQYKNANYKDFRKAIPIVGTWDDHDFGENNSGKWFQSKSITQSKFLDFLDEPVDSPRRQQKGVYTSYTFGPIGKQVKILLLDNRYHASIPGPDGDILGDSQWDWLEDEFDESKAQVHLLVSGTQILHEEHRYEKWSNFPHSRNRLLKLIKESQTPGAILISGDRHIHEIAVKDDSETPYPLYEVTSSGLTHSYSSFPGEPNKYRMGKVFSEKGFGMIEIDWAKPKALISLQIRDERNEVKREVTIPLDELAKP